MASTGLRSYRFPAGLRVLVVDTHACLKILERMLVRCKYQGRSCLYISIYDINFFQALISLQLN